MAGAERRLAAIMFTDIVGFTSLTQNNEILALRLLEKHRELIRPVLLTYGGREVKTIGDAFLVEFASALQAAECAVEMQRVLRDYNQTSAQQIAVRIGIHVGDVIHAQGDVYGDAVNIASRIEPQAQGGEICISEQVYAQIRNKISHSLYKLEPRELKNVAFPIDIYKIELPWSESKPSSTGKNALPKYRVAVLPFFNISPDPSDEYFADGLTEELIDRLSQVKGLEVIARTSIMSYKKQEKKAAEIGRELKAGTLVEGSVRKAGNRIRVTAQLVDANTEGHLWSSRYDKDLEDVFAIQSDIAEQVAQSLAFRLLPSEREDIEKRATNNADAYVLCLKGRYYWNERTKDDNDKALKYYEQAVKLDPTCALAHAGISDCYHIAGDYRWLRPEDAYPRTREYATKAIGIDPRLAEGHASLGAEYFHYEWKWRDAEKELTRAIELKPSYASAHEAYSFLLYIMGRFEESYEQIKRAYELDPLSKAIGVMLGDLLSIMGRREEGIGQLEKIVEENPDFPSAHDSLGFAYYRVERTDEAISELKKAVTLSHDDPGVRADLALLLALAGQREEANSILDDLKELSKRTYVSSVQMACVLYSVGRHDEAFDNLEQAYERRAGDLGNIREMPEMRELRKDPKWISLERRMGFRDA